ncbi:MAG: RNA polymerase sigma-70 factor [Pseudosphingobacterium sp.]|nr:RNA polymerase sigma-70 factor [Olivibacter sp. UJ_SKK_5.1]MDX3914679.1 RNA polymerase sigma-70 factor [Pseudosphingobacterium sp.]
MTEYNHYTEPELISLLIAGNTEALSALYMRYHKQLLLFLQKTAKSPVLAEDLLHDTFVKLWECRTQIDLNQPFKPYLYAIARNQFLNLLKRAKHEISILETMRSYAIAESESTAQWLNARETRQLLEEAMKQLPPRCLAVFRKCHIEELSYKQAAESLGISESTVHNQMVKALRYIREYISLRNSLAALLATITFI